MPKKLLFLFLLIPFSHFLQSQCMTVPETLENLVAASPLVVEGKVRSQQSFWDTGNKNIYTVNEIEIFKVFQGVSVLGGIPVPEGVPDIITVQVVTRGGVVERDGTGLEMDRVSNALELEVGEMGLFLLQGFPGSLPVGGNFYRPTESTLGFVRYDLMIGSAQGVYEDYTDITSEFYGKITGITGLSPLNIGLWDTEDAELTGKPSVERSIVSDQEGSGNTEFEVHAGVGDRLTLTGADFGEEPGRVLFPDANSGGRRYITTLQHQIKQWSDSLIVLEVPYRAGTGKVRIDRADGGSLISSDDLPIGYDHINVRFTDPSGRKAYETQLTSDNGRGGYDFSFQTDFAEHPGASEAFKSLIETWACTTGVNFRIGEVTEVDEDANDGINIVRFDNGDELGGRTLAYARSRYRGCYQDGTIKWFVDEIEVVVNDDYDWYYGDGLPGAGQFDFETVMLHEIGHTQQLGHVINTNEVMHFAVGPQQQKRSLSHIDTIGGLFVTEKSTNEAVCGRDLMENHGGCCETMEVTNQPSDKTLCPDGTTATFAFGAEFAETYKWQINSGEDWVDIADNENFAGTDTPTLTVSSPDGVAAEFRCTADNACGESLVSATAHLTVREMDILLTSGPATCETQGQIVLDRKSTEGTLVVSIDNGASYDTPWRNGERYLAISVDSGSYTVTVQDSDTGCTVNLGIVIIAEPVPLELSATVLRGTECSDNSGQISVRFNDHHDHASVLLSIDGGQNFESFEDSLGSAVIENLENGTYELLAQWEDGSCAVISGPVTIEDECPNEEEDAETPNEDMGPATPDVDNTPDGPGADDTPDPSDVGEDSDSSRTSEPGNPQATDSEETTEIALRLYPNPAKDRIHVISEEKTILGFQLFSSRGALIQEVSAQMQDENTYFMDLAYPQSGVYTLLIRTEEANILRQVIVE